jgi:hypothetical protein
MADHGDFGGGAVFHHVQQGDDGGGREIHVFQFAAVFEQFFAERQRNQFEVIEQGLPGLGAAGRRATRFAGCRCSSQPDVLPA